MIYRALVCLFHCKQLIPMPEQSYLKVAHISLHNAFKCSNRHIVCFRYVKGYIKHVMRYWWWLAAYPPATWSLGCVDRAMHLPSFECSPGQGKSSSPCFQMWPAAHLSPSMPFSVALSSKCPQWCAGGCCGFALRRHTLWSWHCICVTFCRARTQCSYNYRYFPVVERDQESIFWVQQYQLFHRAQNRVCGISVFLWLCF